ncbi:MAG: hypothetical protein H7246_16060, partial [Phycisphaerae bacterium]|nr:hypothetical protein [Saprospiraceae bacterium]
MSHFLRNLSQAGECAGTLGFIPYFLSALFCLLQKPHPLLRMAHFPRSLGQSTENPGARGFIGCFLSAWFLFSLVEAAGKMCN